MAHSGICIIPGCSNTLIVARGYCDAHYRRWKRNGDPIAGRTPNGDAHQFFRDVVLSYEGNECLIWPFNRNPKGYGQIARLGEGSGKKDLVHRKVCEAVNGPPPSPEHEAAHSCGNGRGGCCAKRHLSWKTPGGNTADKFLHGTVARGSAIASAVLTEETVIRIRQMIADGIAQKDIAAALGIAKQTVNNIHKRRTWAWLV